MQPSSRTPEGERNRCLVCGLEFVLEPSRPPGDAPCPHCGSLTWFGPAQHAAGAMDLAQTERLLQHARRGIENGDYDFAISLLQYVLKKLPHRLDCRKALWNAQRWKGSSPKWKALLNGENRRKLSRAKRKQDWKAVDAVVETCLDHEPCDGELHVDLGEAYRRRGMREHAIFAFECAYELLPERSDIREKIEGLMNP